MPTTIATPSNTNAKVRHREPYVSDGLNRKFNGLVPAGIARGASLVTAGSALNVTVVVDPDSGDSIYSYVNGSGQHIAYRDTANRTLDLTAAASTTVFVALFIDYSTGVDTIVEFRTYTEAELFGGSPVAEADEVIVLGKVVVPGSGPIAASAVTAERRREAWLSASQGMKPWINIIQNGDFELGDGALVVPTHLAGYSDVGLTMQAKALVGTPVSSIATANPRRGSFHLRIVAIGVADATVRPARGPGDHYPAGASLGHQVPVKPGDKYQAIMWVAGDSIDASSSVTLTPIFFDAVGANVAAPLAAVESTTGTFAYAKSEALGVVPATAVSMGWGLDVSFLGAGTYDIDDVAMFVQKQSSDGTEDQVIPGSAQLRAPSLALLSSTTDPATRNERTVVLDNEHWDSAVAKAELRMRQLDGALFDWFIDGTIKHDSLGDTEGARVILKAPTSDYSLVDEYLLEGTVKARIYSKKSTAFDVVGSEIEAKINANSGLVFVHNAFWSGTVWEKDDVDRNAVRWDWLGSKHHSGLGGIGGLTEGAGVGGTTVSEKGFLLSGTTWKDYEWVFKPGREDPSNPGWDDVSDRPLVTFEPVIEQALSSWVRLEETVDTPGTTQDFWCGVYAEGQNILASMDGAPLYGRFYLGGSNGTIWSGSRTGQWWIAETAAAASTAVWRCMAASNGQNVFSHLATYASGVAMAGVRGVVIAGQGGEIQHKLADDYDTAWAAATAAGGFTDYFYGAAHGLSTASVSIFVLVGVGGEIQTSTDGGFVWAQQTAGSSYSSDFRAVVYSQELSLFVAAGDGGEIQSSIDGLTWVRRKTGGADIEFLAFGNGVWIAVEAGGATVWVSKDGINWDEGFILTGYGSDAPYDVAFWEHANSFLMIQRDNNTGTTGGPGDLLTSRDAVNWNMRDLPKLTGVTTHDPSIVVPGAGACVVAGEDGSVWATQTSVRFGPLRYGS